MDNKKQYRKQKSQYHNNLIEINGMTTSGILCEVLIATPEKGYSVTREGLEEASLKDWSSFPMRKSCESWGFLAQKGGKQEET